MVILEESQEKTPAGLIWPIAQQDGSAAHPAPIVVDGYLGGVFVQVVVVDGTSQVQCDRVLGMVGARGPKVLWGAVVIDSAGIAQALLAALVEACDVVVLAPAEQSLETARRLVRTLVLPCEPNGIWCTAWNDVYAIATRPRAEVPARQLHARGSNADIVAGLAVNDLVPEYPVNALVLTRIGKGVRGAQIKAINSTVRDRLHPGSGIVKSTVIDPSLADDEIALDILVFGSRPAPCTGDVTLPVAPDESNANAARFGIPAFLRQPST